jgi:hypothetical protein
VNLKTERNTESEMSFDISEEMMFSALTGNNSSEIRNEPVEATEKRNSSDARSNDW